MCDYVLPIKLRSLIGLQIVDTPLSYCCRGIIHLKWGNPEAIEHAILGQEPTRMQYGSRNYSGGVKKFGLAIQAVSLDALYICSWWINLMPRACGSVSMRMSQLARSGVRIRGMYREKLHNDPVLPRNWQIWIPLSAAKLNGSLALPVVPPIWPLQCLPALEICLQMFRIPCISVSQHAAGYLISLASACNQG